MSTAARIEELRKKFDENPRRYFAPLANELRKAGELTQAIALCREHLPKQPGHMSGYIVFGQALYESAELDESRVVFEQALSLDPENLIALHHLGHIAKQQGDMASARRWYERALETDPRNDDIAQQLAMLATPVRPQSAVATPPVAHYAVPVVGADSQPVVDLDGELAFLDNGPLAPRHDLGAIPTPPLAQEAIGAMPLAPTPDASMRAVDFDVVNESLQNPTSQAFLDIEAIESVGRAIAGDETVDLPTSFAADAMLQDGGVPSVAHEPIDLAFEEVEAAPFAEELEGDVTSGGAPPVEFTDAPSDAVEWVAEDPFAFANPEPLEEPAPEAAAEDLESAFEEGLVTAGWPEAADFVTRTPTPRDLTPTSVEITAEVADAFGRGPLDPVQASIPEPEPDLDDVAEFGEVASEVEVAAEAVEVAAEVEADAPVSLSAEPETFDVAIADEPEDAADSPAVVEEFEVAAEELLVETTSATAELPWLAEHDAPADAEEVEYVEASDDRGEFDTPDEIENADAPEQPAFVTETMGELFVAQGFVDRAITVYEELVRRRPYDPVLSARLDELRGLAATVEPVRVFTARERYAVLASRRVARRTPARAATPIGTPVVTATALATPAAPMATVLTPAVSSPLVPTPSHSGMSVPTPAESLSALFGGEAGAPDDFAAQALADAFAPLPLDAPSDSAFSAHFFGNGEASREPTPAYGTMRQPTPAAVVPAVPTPSADFSFDRFFPDPATASPVAAGGTPASSPTVPPSAQPADAQENVDAGPGTSDDLAQFSAWLKGLGNS
jgi:tetratricopeptide (TPR) repeat protein